MSKLSDINSESGRDWKYLPDFCLFSVLEKIDGPIDLVRFGAVTKFWHSVFNIFLDIRRRSSSVPLLLMPSMNRKLELFNLQAESKVSEIDYPYKSRCCGSCYGWLATVDDGFIIMLSNPFKNNFTIVLPLLFIPNQVYSRHDLRKVVLSDDPLLHPNSYAVAVIYGVSGSLAFYQSGRKDWILMDNQIRLQDVIFHKNWIYGIARKNHYLVSLDINCVENNGKPKLNIFKSQVLDVPFRYSNQIYLVKSSMGNLYSVQKHTIYDYGTTTTEKYRVVFRVFKLVFDDENGDLLEKIEVENVDGDIVFVNENTSLAVSVLDYPQAQPNSIYFTADYGYIGNFHLEDKSFGKNYRINSLYIYFAAYIWISSPPRLNSTLSEE